MRRQLRTPPRSRYVQGPASVLDRFVAYANQLKTDLAFRSLWSSAGSRHNSHYVACFSRLLHRSIVASFSGRPSPATNRESHEGRGEGNEGSLCLLALRPLLAGTRARCRFLLGAASAKNIPLEPPRKGKGEVFTLGLPYPCSQRPKKRELSPATSTAKAIRGASSKRAKLYCSVLYAMLISPVSP